MSSPHATVTKRVAGPVNSAMKATTSVLKLKKIGFARGGYTIVELLLVIVIGAILATMTVPSFTRLASGQNARNARDAVVWMAARARSRAIERGEVIKLEINIGDERAWIVRRNAGTALASDTLEKIDFENEQDVQVTAPARITLCYNPRGYAFRCSTDSPAAAVNVTFTHAGKSAVARVRPLGQVDRL